jgi:K+-sensing histidine kinase KdpD
LNTAQGTHFFSVGRDVGALDAAETAVKELLLSSSFDLRAHATNIMAATSLLSSHPAVARDAEAAFLASAMTSSCNLLMGIISNMVELHKLERGEMTLAVAPFSIRAAMHDVLQACSLGGHGDGGVSWMNEAEAVLPDLVEVCAHAHARQMRLR